MARIGEIIKWEKASSQPLSIGETTLTPQAWSLTVQLPWSGITWSRPAAIVASRNGDTEYIPVPDVTRRWQTALLTLAAVMWLVGVRQRKRAV